MTDFYEIDNLVDEIVGQMKRVRSEEIGLDGRCGTVYIDYDFVCVNVRNQQTIEYYGGFEYIDKEFVKTYGDYVFYSRDHDRVNDCLDYFEGNEMEEEVVSEALSEEE